MLKHFRAALNDEVNQRLAEFLHGKGHVCAQAIAARNAARKAKAA